MVIFDGFDNICCRNKTWNAQHVKEPCTFFSNSNKLLRCQLVLWQIDVYLKLISIEWLLNNSSMSIQKMSFTFCIKLINHLIRGTTQQRCIFINLWINFDMDLWLPRNWCYLSKLSLYALDFYLHKQIFQLHFVLSKSDQVLYNQLGFRLILAFLLKLLLWSFTQYWLDSDHIVFDLRV